MELKDHTNTTSQQQANNIPQQSMNTTWSSDSTRGTYYGGSSDNYSHADAFIDTYKRLSGGTNVATPDANNNMALNDDNIHIQPVNNGFMVTINREEGITVDCFNNFNDVLTFLKDNDILDIDTKKIADNI